MKIIINFPFEMITYKKKCIVAEVVDLELAPPRGGKVGRES